MASSSSKYDPNSLIDPSRPIDRQILDMIAMSIPHLIITSNDVGFRMNKLLHLSLIQYSLNTQTPEFFFLNITRADQLSQNHIGFCAFDTHNDLFEFILTQFSFLFERSSPQISVNRLVVNIDHDISIELSRTHYPDILVSTFLEAYPHLILDVVQDQGFPFSFRSCFSSKKPPLYDS